MGLSLNLGGLFSREVRNNLGPRTLLTNPLRKMVRNGKLVGVLNFGGNFQGFITGLVMSQLPNLVWSISGLWDIFTSAAINLYYFDWNVPDATLDAQAKARWQSYGSVLGGVAGNTFGYFVCGVVPATSMMAFDEKLALHVLREVGEEALDELAYNFSYVLRMTVRNLAQQGAGWLYKGARRWLKDPNNPILDMAFGGRADEIRKTWGEANAPSWSFAESVEQRVEKIPSAFWRNFTEEFIDEAMDACIEAGYVVANSMEGYFAQRKAADDLGRGPQRVVEVQPNRDNDREKIVLAGYEPEVRAALPSVLAQHQMIEVRDVGQIVGQPLDDYVRARPFDKLRLKFKMFSFKSPPYSSRGEDRLVEVTVTVPNVDRSKLDWDRLIQVCGGRNGYLWGRYRCNAVLDDGHRLSVYGATEEEAKDRLQQFLLLSESSVKTLSITEEKKTGARLENPKLYKETTRVYPGYVSIINKELTNRMDLGRPSINGNYIKRDARIDLWRNVKPPNFEDKIRELLQRST